MRTEEIRIGNLIEYKDNFYSVCGITDKIKIGWIWGKIYVGAFDVDISQINPIALTSKMLLQLGFEEKELLNGEVGEIDLLYYNYKDIFQISSSLKPVIVKCNGNYYGEYMYYGKEISSLHQLQNIIMDLFKQELKIEL